MYCKSYVAQRAKLIKEQHQLTIPLTKLIDVVLYLVEWKAALEFNKRVSHLEFDIKDNKIIIKPSNAKFSGEITKEYIWATSFVLKGLVNPNSKMYDKGIIFIMQCTYPFLYYDFSTNSNEIDFLVYSKIYREQVLTKKNNLIK